MRALERNGLPHAYILFEGEGHGFRMADNQRRALEAELCFYGRIFGFSPADSLEAIPIENLSADGGSRGRQGAGGREKKEEKR